VVGTAVTGSDPAVRSRGGGEVDIRIVLADAHQLVREGLRSLLERQADMEVVGEAEDGRNALRLVEKLSPDVVILEVGMPRLNGIDTTRQIAIASPGVKVIGLSMHSDKRFVSEMLRAGAAGYVLKSCAFEEVASAIRAVVASHVYLSRQVASVVAKDYVRALSTREPGDSSPLSQREREVLQLLAEGTKTKEIATSLFVSPKTVETHRQHIMAKLNIYSVAGLTKYAVREGLTEL
jgi:DNA-binding NarL/FixJ family response regulator